MTAAKDSSEILGILLGLETGPQVSDRTLVTTSLSLPLR